MPRNAVKKIVRGLDLIQQCNTYLYTNYGCISEAFHWQLTLAIHTAANLIFREIFWNRKLRKELKADGA